MHLGYKAFKMFCMVNGWKAKGKNDDMGFSKAI